MVDGGADLHPLVPPRRAGAVARPGAVARRRAWHGLPRRHLDPRPSEGGRSGQKDAAPAQRGAGEALGRSRGGYGTKACVIADSAGRAVAFALAPGQAHELPHAVPLLARLPGVPVWIVADRATAATPSASTSGIAVRGRPSRRRSMKRRSPARGRSTPIAIASSTSGQGAERMARRRHPLREDRHILPRRPLPRRHRRLAQALTGIFQLSAVQETEGRSALMGCRMGATGRSAWCRGHA